MERIGVGVGLLCAVLSGCSWDEFKERSRMAVVGASDAVVHAPKQTIIESSQPRRSYGPRYVIVNGHQLVCYDNGVTLDCN